MPSALIRRNGRYSLRRVIPLDLQALYGRREIVQPSAPLIPLKPGSGTPRLGTCWT